MGASLPGNRLICLSRDTLAPASFERIISPLAAWRHIEQDYRFDDRWNNSLYIVNIFPKSAHPLAATLPEYGRRSKEQLKALTERGEVVCLNDVSVLPAGLFYIDDNGMLICRDKTLFRFDGANSIIAAFNLAVSKRDYRYSGGKPTPTSSGQLRGGSQPAVYHTLNSKNVGRLLAAGGIYNGNVEGFRKTAEQLGGEAPAGYNQVLNETTRGVAIAGASILGIRRLNTARELEALSGQQKINQPGAVSGKRTRLSDPLDLIYGESRNRRQALNKAKDLADIPRSQQPHRQWKVGNDPERRGQTNYKYSEDLSSHGRYYEYTDAYGHKKVVVEHTADPRATGLHAHAGQPKPGADPITYDFKSDRYQKINDPATYDHHIYYEN
ncbi:HNH/endonuclease VII fold putative polymorphic toxin [Pantoea alhagi]|uniref:HNH/endonuclease VII fold putative polymorphic toxin n=1 Tax=Pantoea alhagi TaxID=1891675 RepID=UPI001EEE5987|nr:HNH/endonuclease VII fold putative polymorphic toxin [Pantoea alhagi]